MKCKCYYLLAFLIFSRMAVSQELDQMTYDAYLSGSLNLWERSIQEAKSQYDLTQNGNDKFVWALCQYGLLNATMKDQNEEKFDQYANQTIEILEDLINANYRKGECKALLSAIYGFKIAYSPWMGMFYGPKSSSLMEGAVEEQSDSPLIQKLYGNNLSFTPEMWGGDQAGAVLAYQRSIELFEKSTVTNNWLYIDTFAWLGIALIINERRKEARETFRKVLIIESDYGWVKHQLLPKLEEKGL